MHEQQQVNSFLPFKNYFVTIFLATNFQQINSIQIDPKFCEDRRSSNKELRAKDRYETKMEKETHINNWSIMKYKNNIRLKSKPKAYQAIKVKNTVAVHPGWFGEKSIARQWGWHRGENLSPISKEEVNRHKHIQS